MKKKEEIIEILEAIVDVVMDQKNTDPKQLEKMESVLGVVHTLILDNRTDQLIDVLNFHFPRLFAQPVPKIYSLN